MCLKKLNLFIFTLKRNHPQLFPQTQPKNKRKIKEKKKKTQNKEQRTKKKEQRTKNKEENKKQEKKCQFINHHHNEN